MVRLYLILSMLLYATAARSQGKVWLPEPFVQHAMAGDSILEEYLKPIKFIIDPPDSGLVWVYGTNDAAKMQFRRVVHEGREKWVVPFLEYKMDPMVIPRAYIDRFYNADVYLSRHGKNMVLEIVEANSTERIEFVDRVDGQIFTNGFDAINKLSKYKQLK